MPEVLFDALGLITEDPILQGLRAYFNPNPRDDEAVCPLLFEVQLLFFHYVALYPTACIIHM